VEGTGGTINLANYYRFTNSLVITGPLFTPTDITIYTNNNMAATSFFALSDTRIKKDLQTSDNAADLQTLLQLQVTDYAHIDTVEKGSQRRKGFVAQQVKEVYPEAISYAPNFLPNVYQMSQKLEVLPDNRLRITLPKPLATESLTALQPGTSVQLIAPTRKLTALVEAATETTLHLALVDSAGTSYSLTADESEQIFVYGAYASDFHIVDYDRIYTLGVSAIQEMYRELVAEKARVAALEAELNSLKASVQTQANEAATAKAERDEMRVQIHRLMQAMGLQATTPAANSK
jgi:hypothetical protein